MVQPELVLIAVAAVVPPAAFAWLVARWPARGGRSLVAALVAFSWGMTVASWAAATSNAQATSWMAALVGGDRARVLVPWLVAPGIEELLKAAGFVAVVLAARHALATPRGAVAAGALLGLGFAAGENVEYYTLAAVQAGWPGVARAVYLRGFVQAANHAAFTAVAGLGVGWAVRSTTTAARVAAVATALVAAVALHAFWNGVVSDLMTTVLCNPPIPGGACAPAPDTTDLLLRVPLIEAAFLLPIAAVVRSMIRRADAA